MSYRPIYPIYLIYHIYHCFPIWPIYPIYPIYPSYTAYHPNPISSVLILSGLSIRHILLTLFSPLSYPFRITRLPYQRTPNYADYQQVRLSSWGHRGAVAAWQ